MVNKYCRKHGCESSEIKGISEKFVRRLGNCKATTRNEEDTVVAVLKGIRNTNNLVDPALDKVIQCTADKFSTRIRVAALQALNAGSSNAKAQDVALALLKNRDNDSEIRIESYLVLVDYPSGSIANEIKALLDDEPVNQVGAFITTHLASLRSSTDPTRESARQHFANVRTSTKFPTDIRRFSFNREFSYAIGSLGIGAGADASVIYSQTSFLPRSARLNVTGEVFGNTFNLFEIAGRQENLERLFEEDFGPKGVFNTFDLQELYTKATAELKRERRSIRSDVEKFAETVHLEKDLADNINFDISLKLFGTEMYFLSLGDDLSMDEDAFVKKVKSVVAEALTGAKSFNHKFESHVLFLDADLAYPTGVGFPLKLVAQGTAVVRLETSGKFDIKQLLADPKNSKFTLKIVPSYNLEVTGTLSVDGWAVNAGLQVTGSIHSSTGSEVDFKLANDGQNVAINVKLPLKKQEIFSFDHKIVFITQERNQETVQTPLKFSSKK